MVRVPYFYFPGEIPGCVKSTKALIFLKVEESKPEEAVSVDPETLSDEALESGESAPEQADLETKVEEEAVVAASLDEESPEEVKLPISTPQCATEC